jgi:hypothetical protein
MALSVAALIRTPTAAVITRTAALLDTNAILGRANVQGTAAWGPQPILTRNPWEKLSPPPLLAHAPLELVLLATHVANYQMELMAVARILTLIAALITRTAAPTGIPANWVPDNVQRAHFTATSL